jgi:NADH-quinone oxidoreductase subunit G
MVMPTLEIDGRQITVDGGATVIQAADRLNIEIPHYCYHPGLSIAGNCRMCLVEVERMPKLQIACNTRALDGMVVRTATPRVAAARQAVLEFLLLNHPIDCPVCDQAGECKLQDYYMDFGRYHSRMPLGRKVHKGKVIDIGPHVMLDQERCILCTRCTRFLDEVTHTSELGVFERGDHCTIDLFPGLRLDNPYSGNVVDVCPVGALTSREFRFQARVWYLERTESVCAACSRGCSIDVYHRRGEVLRYRPLYNPDVNDWWMCDTGRLSFAALQGERRLTQVLVRGERGFDPVPWADAIGTVVRRLQEAVRAGGAGAVAGLASAQATNEEMFLLRQLLREGLGSEGLRGVSWSPPDAFEDDFLIRGDKNPNTRGLEALGVPATAAATTRLLQALERREVLALVLLRADLVTWLGEEGTRKALEAADVVVLLDSHASETAAYADVVLPIATHVETEGSFTNCDGQVQRLVAAFSPPGDARSGWSVLAELSQRLGVVRVYGGAAAVFDEIGAHAPAFRGLRFAELGPHGRRLLPEHGAADAAPAPAPEASPT